MADGKRSRIIELLLDVFRLLDSAVGHVCRLGHLVSRAGGRAQSVEKQADTEAKIQQIADHLREVIWLGSPGLTTLYYVNRAYEQVFGLPVEAFYRNPLAAVELILPEDRPRIVAALRQYLSEDGEMEYRIRRPDGQLRWIRSRAYPIRDEAGAIYRVAGIVEDITDQKRIQSEREELLASTRDTRDRMIHLVESMQEGFCAIDTEERFTYVNRAAERLLNTSRDNLIGRHLWEVYPWLEDSVVADHIRHVLRDREPVQFNHFDKPLDLWLYIHVFPMTGGASILFDDITERHRADEIMRESERSFRALGNTIPQLAWMADPDGNIFWYNSRWYDYTGSNSASDGNQWAEFDHPDYHERVWSGWMHAVRTGEPWEDTFPIRNRHGEYRWFLSRAMPIRNARGQVTRWFGTNTDVTDQMNIAAEREELLKRERSAREEAEQRRAELARVTESRAMLMRGFGHDVKNPLGAADGYLQLLEAGTYGKLESKQVEAVQKIRGSIDAALSLIEDLLSFARAEAGEVGVERASVDLREVVREIAEEYRAQAEANGLSLNIETSEPIPLVDTDPERVQQILANLLSNAVKYTVYGGIIVSVHLRHGGDAPDRGNWIAIDVRDTGPGISKDQQELIFNEFRRAPAPGGEPGVGIGLAIARNVAHALGGEITLRSALGAGSTFTLWIPVPDS